MRILGWSNGQAKWLALPVLLGGLLLLAGCGFPAPPAEAACPATECPVCPEVASPEPVSYQDQVGSSAHADAKAEAFTHWDEDAPPEIPTDCAKCHSRPGYLDFLGVDGTEASRVDNAAKIGTTITCFVCHNEVAPGLTSVVFPSGVRIANLGPEAACIECHDGRAATPSVREAIEKAGLTGDDTPSENLAFVNSHAVGAATSFGAEVHGAFEYEGKSYHGRFMRGDTFLGCIDCHDQHTLEISLEFCQDCHTSGQDDVRNIRVDSTDYDGDGDTAEGIAGEIETMYEALYRAMQAYAWQVAGKAIVYDAGTHPYFFVDTDGDGQADPEESDAANEYDAWTARLLRAAYNLNYVSHDPGAFAHNSDYVMQVLYDSLSDIGGDTTGMSRPPGQE